jgi:sugar lactone lactonase YvrE
MTRFVRAVFIITLAAGVATARDLQAQTVSTSVVASNLDNPRGLNFSADGSLYVAEAGKGGDGPCVDDPAEQDPEVVRCYGETGAITRIDLKKGTQVRLVNGLPSLAIDGGGATGPHDISFQGNRGFVTIGWGGSPANRAALGSLGTQFGRVAVLLPNGRISLDPADVAQFELDEDPNGDAPDSNPYGILALPGRQVVTDAGGNTLIELRANGSIHTLATFADRIVPLPFPPFQGPMDAVPTTVAEGPDGYLYVGQLTGFPFPLGGANVYRIAPHNVPEVSPDVFATRFTNIIDIAFDASGSLYVLEIARNSLLSGPIGRLVRVDPDGSQVEIETDQPLFAPGGLAIGKDGDIYVTVGSVAPEIGQVLRLDF